MAPMVFDGLGGAVYWFGLLGYLLLFVVVVGIPTIVVLLIRNARRRTRELTAIRERLHRERG